MNEVFVRDVPSTLLLRQLLIELQRTIHARTGQEVRIGTEPNARG